MSEHIDAHFTVAQLAERLSIHRNTASRLLAGGAFPKAIKIGRSWRIPAGDIAAFIEARLATNTTTTRAAA